MSLGFYFIRIDEIRLLLDLNFRFSSWILIATFLGSELARNELGSTWASLLNELGSLLDEE